MRTNLVLFFFMILLAGAPVAAATAFADYSVITNLANKNSPDKEHIKALLLGTARRWPNGTMAKPVDLPVGNDIRNEFYQSMLGKSDMEMKMYWATTIFTGAGVPPKALGDDNDVLKYVEENPDAIGYVHSSKVGKKVRVLLKGE